MLQETKVSLVMLKLANLCVYLYLFICYSKKKKYSELLVLIIVIELKYTVIQSKVILNIQWHSNKIAIYHPVMLAIILKNYLVLLLQEQLNYSPTSKGLPEKQNMTWNLTMFS